MSMFDGFRKSGVLAHRVTSRSSGSPNIPGGINGAGGSIPGGAAAGAFGAGVCAIAEAATSTATRGSERRRKGRGVEIIGANKRDRRFGGNDGFRVRRTI